MTLHVAAPTGLSRDSGGTFLLLRARLARQGLDAQLAHGEDPMCDPVLAARSSQLVSRRVRERIADGLVRACRPPDRRRGLSAAVPVDARAVDRARPVLLKLSAALRYHPSVRAQGVALAHLLLTQPDGPLFASPHPEALYEAAREALLALRPDTEPATSKEVRSRWT